MQFRSTTTSYMLPFHRLPLIRVDSRFESTLGILDIKGSLLSAFAEMGLKLRLDMPEQAMEVTNVFFDLLCQQPKLCPFQSNVEAKLRHLLIELGNAGRIFRIQVCAYKDGQVIIALLLECWEN